MHRRLANKFDSLEMAAEMRKQLISRTSLTRTLSWTSSDEDVAQQQQQQPKQDQWGLSNSSHASQISGRRGKRPDILHIAIPSRSCESSFDASCGPASAETGQGSDSLSTPLRQQRRLTFSGMKRDSSSFADVKQPIVRAVVPRRSWDAVLCGFLQSVLYFCQAVVLAPFYVVLALCSPTPPWNYSLPNREPPRPHSTPTSGPGFWLSLEALGVDSFSP